MHTETTQNDARHQDTELLRTQEMPASTRVQPHLVGVRRLRVGKQHPDGLAARDHRQIDKRQGLGRDHGCHVVFGWGGVESYGVFVDGL